RPRPPRRRRSCRSDGDRDAVAPGEIALDPHVAVAARVQPFADRVALGGTDLQDERAIGPQPTDGVPDDPLDHRETADEREPRIGPRLGRELAVLLLGEVRRVADDEIHAAYQVWRQRCEEVPLE